MIAYGVDVVGVECDAAEGFGGGVVGEHGGVVAVGVETVSTAADMGGWLQRFGGVEFERVDDAERPSSPLTALPCISVVVSSRGER